jgi:ribosomal protein L11 methylase PrmA
VSKLAEQNYLALTGDAGTVHNLGKPFTDSGCATNLASIGTIMALLPDPPARILDMGCGAGWTSVFSPSAATQSSGRISAKT